MAGGGGVAAGAGRGADRVFGFLGRTGSDLHCFSIGWRARVVVRAGWGCTYSETKTCKSDKGELSL